MPLRFQGKLGWLYFLWAGGFPLSADKVSAPV